MANLEKLQAVFLVLLMVGSVLSIGAGSVAAQQSPAEATQSALDVSEPTRGALDSGANRVDVEQSASEADVQKTADVEIADGVRDRGGEAVLLLSVERGLDRRSYDLANVDKETLQADSRETLRPVAEQVSALEHAEVRKHFWLGNVLSVSVDLDEHDVSELAEIPGVTSISPNVEAVHPTPPKVEETARVEDSHGYTYGLQQIDVPGFEAKYGDRGGNATVTVIDDGISNPESGHPDLEFAQTAIASDGNVTTGTLGSAGSHGEHVAGTVSGAAQPAGDVPRYGVAPNASVIMINAFEGGATMEDILASVEYSVSEDSDVTTMSLGFSSSTGYSTVGNIVEDTVQDANAAGTLVTVSAGNSGSGDMGGPTTSPGAEFSSMSVGASNAQGNIAAFSSGDVVAPHAIELLNSSQSYPDHYPREYVNPDVSAPGVQVLSAGPVGTTIGDDAATYSYSSGTSMAAPHVAGAATLLQSMTEEDLDPKLIEMALAETAEKPENDHPSRFGRDIRYGTGIINVTAAAEALESGTMEIDGTVTDTDGDPISGASVSTDSGALTSANESGNYTLQTTEGEVELTADAFGYEAATQTVSSGDEPVNFQLEDELAVDLLDGQDVYAEFGGQVNATADVRNVDNVTVSLAEETNVSADDLSLSVAGQDASFGDPVDLGGYDGMATVTVDIADDADVSEGDVIALEHTFEGLGQSVTAETGPTTLTEELDPAFFELSNLEAADEITVGEDLPITVDVTNTGQETATKDVQMVVDGNAGQASLPPSSYELAPGESMTVEISAGGIGGLYTPGQTFEAGFRSADSIEQGLLGGYIVDGLNDEINTSVALQAEGTDFQISSLDAPTEVDPGEEVQVNATVHNIGSEAGEQEVAFTFDGETVATETVALDAYELDSAGNSAEVTFTVTAPDEAGVYTHGVATANDSETASLGVGVSVPSVTVVSTNEYGPDTVTLLEQGLALNGQAAQVSYASASEVDAEMVANTDVFVFHNLEGVAGEVIPAVEESPTTTAVYLEQFADANAIAQRSEVLGDPASATADFSLGGPPVEFTVTQDHPLFDGVADAGESFVVHDGSDSDYVFFEGASGETLAESGLQGESPDGPTAAVDPDSGSVLLGTIAPNSYESVDVFTDDAARVLANSVSVAQDGIVSDAVGSTSIDADFVGTVEDAEEVTVTAENIVSDGEIVDGGALTFTVGGEPVASASIDNGTAEASFDPAQIDAAAGETLTVGVEEMPVADTAEVDTVHETLDLEDGYNLLSVPQAADLSAEDVGAINTWNTSAGTYETVTQSEFDSASDLHNGLYVSATSDDARLGFTFSDDVPAAGTAEMENGWSLTGSNFAIDSPEEGDTRTLSEDLIEVDPAELSVFSTGFDQRYDGQTAVGSFDAYWAFNDEAESEQRAIISPGYDTADREDVLGLSESDFEITYVDASVVPRDTYQETHDDVLGSDEQAVEVAVEVTNDGSLDTQFVDLGVDTAMNGSFEHAERSLGLTLDEGETETVTLTYALSQEDVPGVGFEATTDDDSATTSVELGSGGLYVEDQALTLDDEFVVSSVDFGGEATIQIASNGTVVGETTVADGTAYDLPVEVNASAIENGEVEVRLLDAEGDEQTSASAMVSMNTIEVSNEAPATAFADAQNVDVPVDVTNNALIEQEITAEFTVAGEPAGNETLTVSSGHTAEAVTFTADVSGLSAGDSVEHTVSAAGSSDTKTLSITEAALTFSDQASPDGEVLIEDVTASEGQAVVLTTPDLEIVDGKVLNEDMVDGTVTLNVTKTGGMPGEYVAHIVADESDVSDESGFVNDEATVYGAHVTVDNVWETIDEEDLPYSVEEVTVSTADLYDAEIDGTNFTVQIREDGEVIGESDTLNGSNSDVTVSLDDPITADSPGATPTQIEAVLVDESGEAFQWANGTTSFSDVSDDAGVVIETDAPNASVSLPDQEIGAANGSDAVLVEDVSGNQGQHVVVTDDDLNVLGTHTLEDRAAGEEVIVELEESVEPGEYRAHLTSDVSLVGGDGVVTDAGTLLSAELSFADQEFVGSTSEVVVETASVLDGAANDTEFAIAIHDANGDIVGTAASLTAENSDVTVNLDESIDDEGSFSAMLHFSDGTAGAPIPVVADGEVSTITDSATITPIASDATFDDQILGSGDEVLVEDVQAAADSTIVLTYANGGNTTIVGTAAFPASDAPTNASITVGDTGGFPGEHTAHVIPTDQLSGEYAPGDNVSASDAANATTSVSATVYDASLALDDQTVEDSTDEITVSTATLLDGADATEFGVELTVGGEVVGSEMGLTGENSDVTVSLDESIDATTDVTATLVTDDGAVPQAGASTFSTLTDSGTVTVETATGGNVDFADQAVGADGEVVVENVQPVDVNEVTTDAGVEPQSDFLVLLDADGEVVDYEPFSEITAGDAVALNASTSSAGEHTVAIHEPNAAGDAPDPNAPRDVSASAMVYEGMLTLDDQQYEEQADSIELSTATLLDGTSDGGTFTVNVTSGGEVIGSETFSGANEDVSVSLDDPISADGTSISAELVVDGETVQQASGTGFQPITDDATVSIVASNFDVSNLDIGGQGADATVQPGASAADITVDLANTGEISGAQELVLTIADDSGTTAISETLQTDSIPDGYDGAETFSNVAIGDLEPGSYDVTVASDDDDVTGTLTVEESANFAVSINGADSDLDTVEGEDAIVNATIENTGDQQATQTVSLDVAGSAAGSQDVTLAGGESQTVEFSYTTSASDDGASVTVSSDDDSVTGTLTVDAPANYDITIDSIDNSVTAGDDIVVDYTITNTGDVAGSQSIELLINGSSVETSTPFELGAGEDVGSSFTYTTGSGDVPEVTVTVSSDDDDDSSTVTVEEAQAAN